MRKNNKGFVVSAVLYPLLVLFLSLIMGLLAMTDTRKRILDKMKLEISDSIFDEATCSCDTIINKLNYIIRHGVGGGGGGSFDIKVTQYETPSDVPLTGNSENDIAVITENEITSYHLSRKEPSIVKEGMVWIHINDEADTTIHSDYSDIPILFVSQYINEEWVIKKAYIYSNEWKPINYVSVVKTFDYIGNVQTFTANYKGTYKIELWGAQGGGGGDLHSKGAYTSGEILLEKGQVLYVYVGQGGYSTRNYAWNGGGGSGAGYWEGSYTCSSGGGATDVRLINGNWDSFASLLSRIMVAGGGGGRDCYNGGSGTGSTILGYAGGLNGSNGSWGRYSSSYSSNLQGYGGTQTSGGKSNNGSLVASFGKGAPGVSPSSANSQIAGAGGGGGYYGGGGGLHGNHASSGGGGGGSSYISGHNGCRAVSGSSTASSITVLDNSIHYSGMTFTNTKMVDGAGYSWTSSKGALTGMPIHNSDGTQNGNMGNGHARITLIEVK